jgi:hypothetical protein
MSHRKSKKRKAIEAELRRRFLARKKAATVKKKKPVVKKPVVMAQKSGELFYTRIEGKVVLDEKRSWGVEFEIIMARRKEEAALPPEPEIVEIVKDPEVDVPISDAVKLLSGIDSNLSVDEYSLQKDYDYPIDENDNERNTNEVILSKEGGMRNYPLIIASARLVFEKATMEKFVDVEIKELVDPKSVKVQIKKNILKYGTPKIDQFEWHGLRMIQVDNYKSLPYSRQWTVLEIAQLTAMGKEEGEKNVYTNRANTTFSLVADAYNYKDDKGRKSRANIKFTWKFTSSANNYDVSVQNKIVHHGRVLRITNCQRHHTGRYTCEITNDKGNSYTKTIYVVIHRTGRAVAIEMNVNGTMIPNGKKKWQDTNPAYDKKFIWSERFLPKYDLRKEAWVREIWNGEKFVVMSDGGDVAGSKNKVGRDLKGSEMKTRMSRIKLNNKFKGETSTKDRDFGYWRLPGSHDIYFSNSKGVIKFISGFAMLHHKFANDMPLNFGSIDDIEKGESTRYTKVGDEITIYDEEITTI